MTLKILAIDDSRTIREMLRMCLARAGFDVHTAEDGVAGLETLAEVEPDVVITDINMPRLDGVAGLETLAEVEPDVVITDINMPRLDGFGVISAIREDAARTALPILVLTTESAQDLKARARDSGATGWIVKPFDDVKLIAAIRRIAAT